MYETRYWVTARPIKITKIIATKRYDIIRKCGKKIVCLKKKQNTKLLLVMRPYASFSTTFRPELTFVLPQICTVTFRLQFTPARSLNIDRKKANCKKKKLTVKTCFCASNSPRRSRRS